MNLPSDLNATGLGGKMYSEIVSLPIVNCSLSIIPPILSNKVMNKVLILFIATLLFQSCSSLRDAPKYELDDGYYTFRQGDTRMKKVFVESGVDTVKLYPAQGGSSISVIPTQDEFFIKKSFDADITTIGFKVRPETTSLPRQVNANFNGNIYMGYRIDRFQFHFEKTPAGVKKSFHHRAITMGGFGGFGATSVNPWTTNYAINDEYDGFVVTRGLAAMIGLNSLTVGVGLGWDYLTGRDKDKWIYQNKPWVGLSLGLNIN
jgi:hypothetical protein